MHIKLLDCTLRDGGYYNAWDFDVDLVESYLQAMDALDVDYVELGFRFIGADGFKGALAYSTDAYIRELHVPEGLRLGVMLNASDVVNYGTGSRRRWTGYSSPPTNRPSRSSDSPATFTSSSGRWRPAAGSRIGATSSGST